MLTTTMYTSQVVQKVIGIQKTTVGKEFIQKEKQFVEQHLIGIVSFTPAHNPN